MWPFKNKKQTLEQAILTRPCFVEGLEPTISARKKAKAEALAAAEAERNHRYNNASVLICRIKELYPSVTASVSKNEIHEVIGATVTIVVRRDTGEAKEFYVYGFSDHDAAKDALKQLVYFLEG